MDWTDEQSKRAMKHIETANYELGELITRVEELHGDVKVVRSTIENEIRPNIQSLKANRDEDTKTLISFKDNCFRCSTVAKNWYRIKWMVLGMMFTGIGGTILYFFNSL